MAEAFLQAATQAPQPIQVAASKAISASSFKIRILFASGAFPVFTDINPPAVMIRSKAERSTVRSAITGKGSDAVWDYLRLKKSIEARTFTEFPHFTLGIHRDYLHAIVIVPNGLRRDFRKNLLDNGYEAFEKTFYEVLTHYLKLLGHVKGAVPWVEIVQRRYPSQRSEPFVDALLEFDLRTAFPPVGAAKGSPKLQPQWLQCTYQALSDRNANLQLATGVRFCYEPCPDTKTPKILDHIAHAWMACAPLIDVLDCS